MLSLFFQSNHVAERDKDQWTNQLKTDTRNKSVRGPASVARDPEERLFSSTERCEEYSVRTNCVGWPAFVN